MDEAGRLILGVTERAEDAWRLRESLEARGVRAFVTHRPWLGQKRPMVGYFASDGEQELWLEDASEETGVPCEILRDGQPDAKSRRLTVVFPAASVPQAHLLKNLLQRAGIDSMVLADVESPASARVLVADTDEARARRVVGEFLAATGADDLSDDDEMTTDESQTLIPWPACPECEKPREATCPKCHTTAAEMPPADGSPDDLADLAGEPGRVPEGAEGRMWVLCPLCDWVFSPAFYRRCVWCGHDYGAGLESEPPREAELPEPLGARAWMVILLLAATVGGLLAWLGLAVRS